MTTAIQPGTRVRFTTDNLGLMPHATARFVEPEMAMAGDEGVYQGPSPVEHLAAEDWHVIQVGGLVCVCHSSHFEVV